MTPIYLIILILSALFPFFFTLIRLDLIKEWKKFFISTTLVAIVFLIWDYFFTTTNVWGFNADYCIGIYALRIPIEEYLFFFIIPFCSLFLHFSLLYIFPKLGLNIKTTYAISAILILLSLLLVLFNTDKAYTTINYTFLTIVLIIATTSNIKLLQQFYISFLLILIPFLLVNGILTGIATETPIVWYNNNENLNIRLLTIPIEDIGYAFSMLLGNLLIFEFLKNKSKS